MFSSDGRYVAWASQKSGVLEATVHVREVPTGAEISLITSPVTVSAIAFSPDNGYLAIANGLGTTQIVHTDSAEKVAQTQQDGEVKSVSFSPDGKYLATASTDRTARVWAVGTGQEVARMTFKADAAAVSFSPDGKYLAAASADKTTIVSPWRSSDMIDAACARLTHNLKPDEWSAYVGDASYNKTCRDLPIGRGLRDMISDMISPTVGESSGSLNSP